MTKIDTSPAALRSLGERWHDALMNGDRGDGNQVAYEMRDALRAVADEKEKQGWRPIETAPKDGTEVLLWHEDYGQFIGSYTSADAFSLTQEELDETDEETLLQEDWFTQWPTARRLEGSEVPTHWQHLPEGALAMEESATDHLAARIKELEAENARLRADVARLDWFLTLPPHKLARICGYYLTDKGRELLAQRGQDASQA